MKDHLTELEHIIRESQTLAELVGAVRIWARSIFRPTDLDQPIYQGDVYMIEILRTCNYRQQWALTLAQNQARITTSELARRFNISMEAARLDLHDLVEQGRLLPISNKKGRFYIPIWPNDDTSGSMDSTGMGQGVPQPPRGALRDTLSYGSLNPEA